MTQRKTYEGVLLFHSETGTEGALWAFQDSEYMGLKPPNQWRCSRCGRIWDKDLHPEEPKPSFSYWIPRDRLSKDQNPKNYIASYHGFSVPQQGTLVDPATGIEFPVMEGPTELNESWIQATNLMNLACYEQGHEHWESPEERWPDGVSSYEGFHVLSNGDHLAIHDPSSSRLVWEGDIDLNEFDVFTEDAYGYWIHSDQKGVDRDVWAKWFLEGYPAILTIRDKMLKSTCVTCGWSTVSPLPEVDRAAFMAAHGEHKQSGCIGWLATEEIDP